jgi:phosphohistidine phosphatase
MFGGSLTPVMETKRLILLRHAKSSWDDPTIEDHARPLNSRGRQAADRIGRYIRDQEVILDLVLSSTALRARQTLQLLQLDSGVTVLVEDALYGADAAELMAHLRRVDDAVTSVLLIGHNPGIQSLAMALSGARNRLTSFPTAALADLRVAVSSWDGLGPETATLSSFVTPRTLD